MDKIKITGLKVFAHHGVFPEETKNGQDFYVNVTVKVDGTDIDITNVEFTHEECNEINQCQFNPSEGQFIVHISSLPLTINKDFVSGTTPQVGETFIFTIKGTSNTATSSVDMTVTLVAKKNALGNIVVEPITINNLPIGTYTVTEDMAWSWRYKVVEADSNGDYKDANASKTVNLGDVQSVTFINQIKINKWIDSNAYCENTFAAVKNGTAQGNASSSKVNK